MTTEPLLPEGVVFQYRFSRAALGGVPVPERNLFLAAAHVTNELNLLHKLAVWSGDFEGTEPLQRAQICQSFILFRLLAGKLNEANEMLRRDYFATQISRVYDQLLPQPAQDSLAAIKRYFARENIINRTRNDFAFHYSAAGAGAGFEALPPEEQLDYYVGRTLSNTLYYYSEVSVAVATIGSLDRDHFGRFVGEIITVSKHFLHLLDGLLFVFTERHGRTALLEPDVTHQIDLTDSPPFSSVKIPWFTSG